MIAAFFYGLLLAFGLILPLGPQNMFILNQGSKSHRFRDALPAVITASLCDTILILLASFGISLFILDHPEIKRILLVAGIIFLSYLGITMWRNAKHDETTEKIIKHLSARKQILFCASVSILNPHAILDTITVIGSNALLFQEAELFAFICACVLLSWLWFTGLALFGKLLTRFEKFRFYLDRFASLVILISAGNLIRFF